MLSQEQKERIEKDARAHEQINMHLGPESQSDYHSYLKGAEAECLRSAEKDARIKALEEALRVWLDPTESYNRTKEKIEKLLNTL